LRENEKYEKWRKHLKKSLMAISAILSVLFVGSSCGTTPNTEIPKINGLIYILDTSIGRVCRVNDDGSRACIAPTDSLFTGSVVLPRETALEVFGLLPRCRDWGSAEKEKAVEFLKRNPIVEEVL